jgi:hypothetical protein
MKKFLKYLLLFLIPFAITVSAILAYFNFNSNLKGLKIRNLPSFNLNDVVKFSRYTLEKAPSETLVGTMLNLSGTVKYESRMATESALIEKAVNVQQGDIIETGEDGSVSVQFKDIAELNIKSLSKTEIVQTLPANLVFWHKSGSVVYKKIGPNPVSVRAHRLLIDINGEAEIIFNKVEPAITIHALKDSVKTVFNNINNETQVVIVDEGKSMEFNNEKRRPLIINN